MDIIIQLFQLTLDSQNERGRVDAEAKLKEHSAEVGFLPALMQIIVMEEIPIPVRQAAVIYMKNMIGKNWKEREVTPESSLFIICETDKKFIRDSIIEAVISAKSDLIRRQLTVCVQEILSFDYPERWPEVPAKLQVYLTNDQANEWHGALLVLYQLVKKYEYKREAEREPVIVVMTIFLPLLQNRCASLTKIDSPDACTLVALIFKIFRSLIQLNLPLQLINENNVPQWMGLFKTVLESPLPIQSEEAEPEERPLLPCWKVRKWAITLINKIFDRYGLVGSVEKQYHKFAEFYDKNYSESMTQLVLKILDAHRKGVYVAPRVLHHALSYLTCGVYNSRSWKVVKPHLDKIVEEVIFPLMCHSDEDEELWQDDPQDYIRMKYDVFEDFLLFSPNEAAKAYLVRAAEKRKDVLKPVVDFISKIFAPKEPVNETYPRQKDGALHMMGALAEALTKKKVYKKEMQSVLTNYILPEFGSTFGYLRARACWVVQQFSIIDFTSEEILDNTIKYVLGALTDAELPVQVEAGIAIKHLIENQEEKSTDLIRPNVQPLITSILDVLKRSENDELTGTIAKLVECYPNEVKDIAVILVTQLSQTFMTLVTSDDDYDNKSVTAMGVLETLQTVMGELEEKTEIIQQLEQVVYKLIITVLEKELMEFYEEIFSLINECTVVKISPTMWNLLEVLHATLHNDTADYFTEMMPCLHNYVTVDPDTFLTNEKYCEIIFNMCQKMLQDKCGEDAEMQAAKLIEVIILQYLGKMNLWLPRFIELALGRLTSELRTSELRVMLIQVIIASIMSNPSLALAHLASLTTSHFPHGMVAQMLLLWLKDTDCFLGLHDRKVYVLGMCTLLDLPLQERPQSIVEAASQILPSLLVIFDGLNHIYEKINNVEDGDEEIEEDEENGELGDSDDEYDEDGLQQVEKCDRISKICAGEIEDDDWENDLDVFTTPIDDNIDIDEFISFKKSFQLLEEREKQGLFTLMTQSLNEEQMGAIQQVINEGIRREKAAESRHIEAAGGYTFDQVTVDPKNFSFGGGLS